MLRAYKVNETLTINDNMKLRNHYIILSLAALLCLPACNDSGTENEEQTPPKPAESISLSDKSLTFAASDAAPQTVTVSTTSPGWTLDVSPAAKWLKAEESGQNEITVSVTDNGQLDQRTGYVYVRLYDLADSVQVTQFGLSPVLEVTETEKQVGAEKQSIVLDVISNVEYDVTISSDWITYEKTDDGAEIVLSIEENQSFEEREATVTLSSQQAELSAAVTIRQDAAQQRVRQTADTFIPFTQATTASSASAYPVENINDNNLSTYWQTPSRGVNSPAEITFDFGGNLINRIDYMVYYPSTPYGQFGEVDIYYTTGADRETFLTSYDFGKKSTHDTVRFGEEGISQVKTITLKVKTAAGRDNSTGVLAGIAELEFFRNQALREVSEIFTDYSCSELLPEITLEKTEHIVDPFLREIAAKLASGSYDKDFRIASYRAYPHPDEDAARFKTNRYTKYDNITGMCITRPGTYHVAVETDSNVPIYMDVINWENNFYGSNCAFQLKRGINTIEIPEKKGGTLLVPGIIYLRIHASNFESINPVKIHFMDADVNGYFDAPTMDESRFETLLANAKAPEFDMRGRKTIFTATVKNLRANTKTGEKAKRLMAIADTVISLEEDIQGHYKYNTGGHRNRMLFGPSYGGFMFAASYIVGFGTELTGTNPDNLIKGLWGMAHEVGHCNQIQKGMKWVGTTEVTNNICSAYVEYTMRGGKEKSAVTPLTESDFFNQALRDIAFNQDSRVDHFSAGSWDGMYYEKVVPFWQLYLYYTYVGGVPDLFRDAYNTVRNRDDNETISDGEAQMNFIKLVCDLTKTDLTEFFEFWRFLSPTQDVYINDYGCRTMTITQEMIDEVKQHIAQYPKPKHKIQYICEGNIDQFISPAAPKAGEMTVYANYVRAADFTGVVAYELCDGPDNTVTLYLPKPNTSGVALKNEIATLIWKDNNNNASPGNINSQTYYCSDRQLKTVNPKDFNDKPYVYGITADGTRIPATNNPE